MGTQGFNLLIGKNTDLKLDGKRLQDLANSFSLSRTKETEHTFGEPSNPTVSGALLNAIPLHKIPASIGSAVTVATADAPSDEAGQKLPRSAVCLITHINEYLGSPAIAYGTGFHVGGGWLISAHHVLPDIECLRNHRANFFKSGSPSYVIREFDYSAGAYFASVDGIRADDAFTYEFDYVVAKLKEPLGDDAVFLGFRGTQPTVGEPLDILRPVRKANRLDEPIFDVGIVRSVATINEPVVDRIAQESDRLIFHTASAFAGDSGAPMLDSSGQVIGIFTHGSAKYAWPKEHPKGLWNWGTKITAIANDLKLRAPKIFEECTCLHACIDDATSTTPIKFLKPISIKDVGLPKPILESELKAFLNK